MPTIFLYELSNFLSSAPEHIAATTGRVPFTLTTAAALKPIAVEVTDSGVQAGDLSGSGPFAVQKLTNRLTIGEAMFHAGAQVSTNYKLADSTGREIYAVTIGDRDDASRPTAAIAALSRLDPNTVFALASPGDADQTRHEFAEFVCFTGGTLIETSKGDCPVENLSVGDRVQTHDNGLQSIRWIGQRTLHLDPFAFSQSLRPVCIPAHAFGPNAPSRDLYLSPQHRVLLGGAEVLAPAKSLVGDLAWQPARSTVTYHHLLFDRHEIIRSNNLWTESFYPGDQAQLALSEPQQEKLYEILPDLRHRTAQQVYRSARPFASLAQSRALMREIQHGWDIDPDYDVGSAYM